MRSFLATLFAATLFATMTLDGAQVPRPSPEFAVIQPNGQQELVSKYKGKVVVLMFLSTTCPHCQNASRLLSKLKTELGPKGFQPFGAAINPEGDVTAFVKQFAVNFPVGKTSRETAYAYLQHSIMAPTFYVPQVVFIDRTGVIRGQYGGSDPFLATNEEANIRGMIEKLLAEGAGSKSTAKPAAKVAKKG